jgi:indole-3-glycerol phosphate synthase
MTVPAYTMTGSVLDKILARKVDEVAALRREAGRLRSEAAAQPAPRGFTAALHRETVALIAEVKKASPSKGVLVEDFEPVSIARTYAANGAAAISVLVDETFFQGHVGYLRAVRLAVTVPLLFKEFVLDSVQVVQARAAGADAVLLIAAALDDGQLRALKAEIDGQGMDALIEVHDEAEMERALRLGASLIGVNNRDLRTFREDMTTTERLARLVGPDVTLVAESAIRSPDDVARMGRAGAHAVLVGEALIKAEDRAAAVRAYSNLIREVHA